MVSREMKDQIARLSRKERKELATYLAELERLFPPQVVKALSKKINDKNPSHWFTLEEAEEIIRWKNKHGASQAINICRTRRNARS